MGKTGLFGAPPCPTTLLDVPSARKDREQEEKIIIIIFGLKPERAEDAWVSVGGSLNYSFALLNGRDDVGLANDELLRGCEYEKRKRCRKARASDLGL